MEKRTLRIEPVPATALVRIAWNGGGEVPAAISGYYTSTKDAQRAIDIWSTNQGRPEVVVVEKDSRDDKDPKKLVVKTEDIEPKPDESAVFSTPVEQGDDVKDTVTADDKRVDKYAAEVEKRAAERKLEKKSPGRPRKE